MPHHMFPGSPRAGLLVVGLTTAFLLGACSPTAATQAPVNPTGGFGQPSTTPAAPTATGSNSTSAPASAGSTGALPSAAAAASVALTCTAPATATVSGTEGPYYKSGAPQLANLVTGGVTGTPLTYTGYVVDTSCRPLANARVEIWQADAQGAYDNSGYTLRGWVLTDATGRYTFRTVIPGEYPGRTEHIHVKVTPSGGTTLTTQMYFPDQASNAGDGIYEKSLLLTMTRDGSGWIGTYTFVMKA